VESAIPDSTIPERLSVILDGMRVLDRTSEIAGPYCTKLLADAGADVVKLESTTGDPLRRWRSGALFEFLNTSKRSVTSAGDALLHGADVLVTNDSADASLVNQHPSLVVVTITPFGCDGPWADRPATEFTLQAWCGSTGQRGVPEEPPIAAGGRLGEWVAGSYAAVAALAAAREADRSGNGEHVDVALLDCMALTMTTFPSVFASFLGWPRMRGTGRMIDVPSVEPTSDGYVAVTTNAAQQFRDFLVLIGHGELVDDADLAKAMVRFKNRAPFLAMVHEYTTKHTTDEVLDEAALLRIPSGPVLNGATVTGFEQFVERGVFEPGPSGRFVQPRVPYRIGGLDPRPFAPAPGVGEHDDAVEWTPRPSEVGADAWRAPLHGLKVIDLTAWWAGPSAPHALACLGADVVKVESASRPDGARFTTMKPPSEDQWWEWGALFHSVNTGKRGITLDLSRNEGIEVLHRLLAGADVLIENFTPRVMEQFGLDWDEVHRLHPHLVMVRMPAFGLDGPWRERTGFAQTMECMAGMAWVTGWPDGPPVLVRGTCDPLAGMHGAFATLLALEARDRDGEGRLVEAAMVESALNVAAEQVVEHGASGALLAREGNRSAGAAPQGLYRCAGEDRWLAVAVATDAQWLALRGVLGEPAPEGTATVDGRRAAHDQLDAELADWCGDRDADETADALNGAGVPAAVVIPTRDVSHNVQLRHRGLFELHEHPVTGAHELPGMPFRFSRVERWLHRPAPTLGQHNDEVLHEAGLDDDAIAELRAKAVIGESL
jgi:crotonobetainyl-CoA:carnitine CoA-transferase CaiB-like acyl-CoA transferase